MNNTFFKSSDPLFKNKFSFKMKHFKRGKSRLMTLMKIKETQLSELFNIMSNYKGAF